MLIHRLLLASVLPAVAKDSDTRYYLQAIKLQNGGPTVRATATDGHVLITATGPIASMPEADFPAGADLVDTHSALMPRATVAAIVKGTKKTMPGSVLAGTKIGINPAGHTVALTTDTTDTQAYNLSAAADQASNFPDFDRVVASAEKCEPAATVIIGVAVLEALIAAAKAGEAGSIKFLIPATNEARGSVMDPFRATWTIKGDTGITVNAVAMPMAL
jgi:hypothetical protein